MTEAFFFLSVGLAFLGVLVFWAQRRQEPTAGGRSISKTQEILIAVQSGLPSRAVGERIFALQDWEFVLSQAAPPIRQRFLRERKAMALSWLWQIREGLRQLMLFHKRAVRGSIQLNPAVEVRLAVNFHLFLLVYNLLWLLIWLRGPFLARVVISHAGRFADQFAGLSGGVLADLDPRHLQRIKDDLLSRSVVA
jgi:hypothetical protein